MVSSLNSYCKLLAWHDSAGAVFARYFTSNLHPVFATKCVHAITGIILWELVAFKKPYDGMSRTEYYSRVVHGGERPPINKKWPEDLTILIKSCWE